MGFSFYCFSYMGLSRVSFRVFHLRRIFYHYGVPGLHVEGSRKDEGWTRRVQQTSTKVCSFFCVRGEAWDGWAVTFLVVFRLGFAFLGLFLGFEEFVAESLAERSFSGLAFFYGH